MNLGVVFLNLAALAVAVGAVLLAGVNYPRLPERIPIHFGVTGDPDGWAAREMIWLLPAIGLASFGVLFGLGFTAGRAALFLALLNLQTVALFAVIIRDQIEVAMGTRSRLSAGVWVLLGVVVITSVLAPGLR